MKPVIHFAARPLFFAVAVAVAARPLSAQPGSAADTPRVHHSDAKSRNGLYWGGVLAVQPDGRWAMADYPVVTRVDSASVAERAGVRVNDVILSVNGRDARDGQRAFRLRPGETREILRIQRGTEEMEIVVDDAPAPGAAPDTPPAGAPPPPPAP